MTKIIANDISKTRSCLICVIWTHNTKMYLIILYCRIKTFEISCLCIITSGFVTFYTMCLNQRGTLHRVILDRHSSCYGSGLLSHSIPDDPFLFWITFHGNTICCYLSLFPAFDRRVCTIAEIRGSSP